MVFLSSEKVTILAVIYKKAEQSDTKSFHFSIFNFVLALPG
jgi:hypothetical protein